MSSEVCPKCGKSFKRLKSHLPHCKAQKSVKKTSPQNESSSSSLPLPGPDHSPQSSKTVAFTKSNDKTTKLSTTSVVAKKPKQKLSEKIKMSIAMSSPASDASTPPSKASKSKKKVPISSQIGEEFTENKLENIHLFPKTKSTEMENSTQNYKKVIKKMETNLETLSLNESAMDDSISNNLQTSKQKKTSKKASKENIMTKTASNKVKNVTINNVKRSKKDNIWSGEEDHETNLSSENDMWTSRREPKVTLHDVRTTLGQIKQNSRQKSNNSVDLFSTDKLKSEVVNPNSKQSTLVSLQPDVPSQLMTLSPGKSQTIQLRGDIFLNDLSKVDKRDCNFSERAHILKDGLRMDCHTMGLTALMSPKRTFLEAEVSAKAFKKDFVPLLKPNVQRPEEDMEPWRMDHRKQDEVQHITRRALSRQRLGQVTLKKLPDWVVSHSPRSPQDALEMVQRGWQWYYRRYIDAKGGGVGGMAMLLAGCCVLSYVWAYPHLKRDRWRKFH